MQAVRIYAFGGVDALVVDRIASMIAAGELHTRVGDVLPLTAARTAHEMLAGRPHKPGKIVLTMSGGVEMR